MYDFRDIFVLECVYKENIVFRKDILNFWLYYIKIIYNILKINVIILNV